MTKKLLAFLVHHLRSFYEINQIVPRLVGVGFPDDPLWDIAENVRLFEKTILLKIVGEGFHALQISKRLWICCFCYTSMLNPQNKIYFHICSISWYVKDAVPYNWWFICALLQEITYIFRDDGFRGRARKPSPTIC